MSLQRNDMLEQRKRIDAIIKPYMADEGYTLNEKSKFVHSLDSYVYTYTTLSGARDVLKIEINYSDRVHILETKKSASTQKLKESVSFRRLADEELIGSKINALLVRTTPRDIFDVYNLFVNGRIINEILIRKIAIFYVCLGSEIPLDFNSILYRAIQKIKGLTYQRVKETLIPVLHKKHTLNITEMSEYVFKKVQNLFYLDKNDETFIVEFNNKKFSPDVLFDGFNVNDVSNHPMGLWKTKQATN